MKRSNLLFLHDIEDSIEKIQRYVAGMSYHEFISSEVVVDAVARNLEIIGEARVATYQTMCKRRIRVCRGKK